MATITERISEIRDYLGSALSMRWEGNPAYEDIIRSSVEGKAFDTKCEIDIAFIAALLAIPKAEGVFHPRGIILENVHFDHSSTVSKKSVSESRQPTRQPIEVFRFDVADSHFPLPLALRNCTLAETLDLRRARLASLDLTGSTLPALMLQGARLDGALILDKTHLTFGKAVRGLPLKECGEDFRRAADNRDPNAPPAALDANDLIAGDRVSLKESLVRGGIRLRHAQIGGDFVAKQAAIISRRYAQTVCLQSTGYCQRCLRNLREGINLDLQKISCIDQDLLQTLNIKKNIAGTVDSRYALNPLKGDNKRDAWTKIIDRLSCRHSILNKPSSPYNPDELAFDALYLFEAHVRGSVELTDRFVSIGEVSLNSTRIDGGLFCRGGMFFQHDGVALSMDGIKVGGSAYLDKYIDRTSDETNRTLSKPVPFIVHGTVSMRDAIIQHRLFITNAYFIKDVIKKDQTAKEDSDDERDDPLREREHYAFYAKRLSVAGDMLFNKVPSSNACQASSSNLPATGGIFMENAHIGGRLFLAASPATSFGSSQRPFLSLDFAEIAAAAHLQIRPTAETASRVSLRSARLGSLDVSECAHEWLTWDLERLHYDAIENVDKVTLDGLNTGWEAVWTDHILRKDVRGGGQSGVAEALQPFDALTAFLRESGREQAAYCVGIAKEKQITENIRRLKPRQKVHSAEKCAYVCNFHFAWRKFIEFFVGYGYKPETAIIWLMGLIAVGTLVFAIASGRNDVFDTKLVQYTLAAHSHPEKGKGPYFPLIEPQEYPSFSPLLYSLELATPLPELGQESHFEIKDNLFLEMYKWFHIIFGWLLSFLIVLSPTKLLRRE